jgi:hypothetical protein
MRNMKENLVSKYASKAEPRSAAFSEIFGQILEDSNPNEPSLISIQKLLIRSVAERDISAQEACWNTIISF